MTTGPYELTIVERLARAETKLEVVEGELREIHAKMDKLLEQQQTISTVVSNWKFGAAMLFSLGAFAAWVFDHVGAIKGYLLK